MTEGANGKDGDSNPMSKEDDYRAFAARLLELAGRTSNVADKSYLLAMAEAWLNLAGKISRLKSKFREHPAIRATFGPEQREDLIDS